jgi:hypothetical protein
MEVKHMNKPKSISTERILTIHDECPRQKIEINTKGIQTSLKVDGVPLDGAYQVTFSAEVNCVPTLTIKLHAVNTDIILDGVVLTERNI